MNGKTPPHHTTPPILAPLQRRHVTLEWTTRVYEPNIPTISSHVRFTSPSAAVQQGPRVSLKRGQNALRVASYSYYGCE
ncbi:hypothetical protein E2C01_037215 [Portunus trituberculatus]|uniref:Uncharacterized protein n=1 Tax=Portunus trituberculatus TaxID=210409 RepID=A0A5B7FDK3_PORTR|nr:hypothetical protein [Portunus trituberculatus]